MNIKVNHKNEDAAAAKVFADRKAIALHRIDRLRAIVNGYQPAEDAIGQGDISKLDYLLKSLDSVIEDTSKAVGL